MEILRPLSLASPGCIDSVGSIFDSLRSGNCALSYLERLMPNSSIPDGVVEVGGLVTKLALKVTGGSDQGILTLRRALCPQLNNVLRRVPGISDLNNRYNIGKYDLPGGMNEPSRDICPVDAGLREVHEETGLPQFVHNAEKIVAIGCYAVKGSVVVRVGMVGETDVKLVERKARLSGEHTSARIMLPSDPEFPEQWRELGNLAMAA